MIEANDDRYDLYDFFILFNLIMRSKVFLEVL